MQTPKKSNSTIKNLIHKPEIKFYTCQAYGNFSFNQNYEKLLISTHLGSIDSYYKLLEIIKFYKEHGKLEVNPLGFKIWIYIFFKFSY